MKKVEMHCHILPGIDDGAEDMKQKPSDAAYCYGA